MHEEIRAAEEAIEQLRVAGATPDSKSAEIHGALVALLTLCRGQQAQLDAFTRRLDDRGPPLEGVTMDV